MVDSVIGFFFSSRRRHTRFDCDWSSDVCSSDLDLAIFLAAGVILMSLLVATVLLPRALRGVVLPETSRVAEEEQARAWAAEAAIGAIERAQLARLLPTSTSAGVDAGVYAAARSEERRVGKEC